MQLKKNRFFEIAFLLVIRAVKMCVIELDIELDRIQNG
jgi:hypothetical protein